MDQFKNTLRKRIFGLALYNLVLIMLVVLGLFQPSGGESAEVRAFMSGVNAGLFAVAQVVLITGILWYYTAMKNEEKRKALYIYEHDERRLYIQTKVGGIAVQTILFGLIAATIAAGFYHQTVFFTLLGAVLFCAVVKAVLKVYYSNKFF